MSLQESRRLIWNVTAPYSRFVELDGRNLISASRSDLSRREARDTVLALQAKGAKVEVYNCDVVKADQLRVLVPERVTDMPPIRGAVHANGASSKCRHY
jgi:hypothetical protein